MAVWATQQGADTWHQGLRCQAVLLPAGEVHWHGILGRFKEAVALLHLHSQLSLPAQCMRIGQQDLSAGVSITLACSQAKKTIRRHCMCAWWWLQSMVTSVQACEFIATSAPCRLLQQ